MVERGFIDGSLRAQPSTHRLLVRLGEQLRCNGVLLLSRGGRLGGAATGPATRRHGLCVLELGKASGGPRMPKTKRVFQDEFRGLEHGWMSTDSSG